MTTGYLAMCLFHNPRGEVTEMVMAFEKTEDEARSVATRHLEENRLDEHADVREELQIFEAIEVDPSARFSYRDDDVIYAARSVGVWVKPTATPVD
jgi:hypothetical protein